MSAPRPTAADIAASRELRKSIARFPKDATVAQRIIFKTATVAAIQGIDASNVRSDLMSLVRGLG